MDALQPSDAKATDSRASRGIFRFFWKEPTLDKETNQAIDRVLSEINGVVTDSADCRVLLASIRALIARIKARKPRRALEIVMLLGGVVDVAVHGNAVDKARVLFREAYAAFAQSAGSGNRLRFFGGAALGATAMGIATVFVLTLQSLRPTHDLLKQLADPDILVGVIFFSLVGSLTSILVRLHRIDLVEEDITRMVVLAGALQPIVAMGFMCIVYVIIATPLIPLAISADQKTAVEFAAAFLCGFSEKFAPALLNRVEGTFAGGGKSDTTGKVTVE